MAIKTEAPKGVSVFLSEQLNLLLQQLLRNTTMITIKNLEINKELDAEAMAAIMGSGLWSGAKKYGRKTGRYIKKKANRKMNEYKENYRMVKSIPGTFYYGTRGLYRSVRSWF
jgi:hypothetical protein